RCEALSAFAEDARFASLAQSAKRIANILKDEAPGVSYQMDLDYMTSEERSLVQDIRELNPTEVSWPYDELLPRLATLSESLEAYFDKVMVKDPDPTIRANRLAYLNVLRQTFLRVADFSQWQ
ncbi:MAG TPA: DALR anticodon-binding domain-containing protein, partial [Holophagaceae bacterium]|nr:DALR anticodon-binding domain-containing protein [Holophagaceae bacterium]